MKTTLKIAVAAALVMAAPAMAQTFLKPQPMAQKYRDHGAKPATGRAGSAAIEARALMDINGKTDIEVTTGHFEGIGGGGTLGKVQVKLFSEGVLFETDNYRPDATSLGTGTFSYDGLRPGHVAQVQANVSGIDPNRTDVVMATTEVKRRPDLEAVKIHAQPRVVVNAPVTVRGVVSELNGDVGARATCRLFADGTEIGAIPGAWVDASSAVTCEFRTSFASLGSKNLTLRVTDVEPADYDASNNEASLAIEVANANVDYFVVDVWEMHDFVDLRHVITHTPTGSTYVRHSVLDQHYQSLGVWSRRLQERPFSGRITLRHATGGVALPSESVAVQDLPEFDGRCRYGWLASGASIAICSWYGATEVYAWRGATFATYVENASSNGVYGTTSAYYTWTEGPDGTFIALGADYTAELLHETEEGMHGGSLSIPLEKGSGGLNQHTCAPRPLRFNEVWCITQVSHGTWAFGSGSAGGS